MSLIARALRVFTERLRVLDAQGMLACECTFCSRILLVETNLGALLCPHCNYPTVQVWCRVEVRIVPEEVQHAT